MGVKSRTTIAAWYSEHPKLKLCNKVQAVMSCCSATGEGEGGGGEYSGNDFAPWGNDQQSNSGSIGSQSVSNAQRKELDYFILFCFCIINFHLYLLIWCTTTTICGIALNIPTTQNKIWEVEDKTIYRREKKKS